ncbi:hypothetical protein NS44R_14850 [Mammaliicoccus sciuri]|nr:hypothetical protein NS44R_14850 [Mammaliicoccus sciuri]
MHRAEPVPEAASAGRRAVVLPEVGPRAQSRGAGAVQRDGGTLHRAGRGRPLAGARSAVAGGGGGVGRHSGAREARARNPLGRRVRG